MIEIIWERGGRVRLECDSTDPVVRQLLLREGVTAEQAIADVEAAIAAECPAEAVRDVLDPGWRERAPEPPPEPESDLAAEVARLAAEVERLQAAVETVETAGREEAR